MILSDVVVENVFVIEQQLLLVALLADFAEEFAVDVVVVVVEGYFDYFVLNCVFVEYFVAGASEDVVAAAVVAVVVVIAVVEIKLESKILVKERSKMMN